MQLNTGIDKRLCIRVPEAAEPGISTNIMYSLIKLGELCMIEFGKGLLIPRAGLKKMLGKGVTQCKGG